MSAAVLTVACGCGDGGEGGREAVAASSWGKGGGGDEGHLPAKGKLPSQENVVVGEGKQARPVGDEGGGEGALPLKIVVVVVEVTFFRYTTEVVSRSRASR